MSDGNSPDDAIFLTFCAEASWTPTRLLRNYQTVRLLRLSGFPKVADCMAVRPANGEFSHAAAPLRCLVAVARARLANAAPPAVEA